MRAITAERVGAQHDHGQYQVRSGRPERSLVLRQQRVDQQKARGGLDEVLHRQPAGDRRPAQLYREQQDQQQTPPENRHGVTREGHSHDAVVEYRVSLHRRQDAGRYADQQREQDRADGQFDGGRKQREELAQHGLLGDQRFAQVALEHADDIDAVLHHNGLVQAVFLEQLGMAHRIDAAFARHGFNRVSRHHADQEEGQQRHPQESGNDQAQTGKDKAQHYRGMLRQRLSAG